MILFSFLKKENREEYSPAVLEYLKDAEAGNPEAQ